MNLTPKERSGAESKTLNYRLGIVVFLVFVMPALIVIHVMSMTASISGLKDSHVFIFALLLIAVFAGLIILRKNFNEFSETAVLLKQQSAVIEASMDGIAVLNGNGEYIYLNRAHTKSYGYDNPEELLGKSWWIFYDEKEAVRFEKEIEEEGLVEGRGGRQKKGRECLQPGSLSNYHR